MCCQAMGETFLVASAPCVSPVLSWCSRSRERIEALYKMMQLAIRRLHSAQSSCSYSVLKRSLPKPVQKVDQRVAERARISQEVTPHVLRHYLPFRIMSCNGDPPRIWIGNFRSRRAKPPDIARHSLVPSTGSSGRRGVDF